MNLKRLIWSWIFCVLASFAAAQAPVQMGAQVEKDTATETPIGNFADWDSLATRAENVLLRGDGSAFALGRLREELFIWRDVFADMREQNAGRLRTVSAQLAALGPVPADGDDAPSAIMTRRDALTVLQKELQTPNLLAQERFARASGLIAEVDAQIRARSRSALSVRGASPLNPSLWPSALAAVGTSLETLAVEVVEGTAADWRNGKLIRNLPGALFLLGLAVILLRWGRAWSIRMEERFKARGSRWAGVAAPLLSLWQAILPTIGLVALYVAIIWIDVLGVAGKLVLDGAIGAGFVFVLTLWLAGQFFPAGAKSGPMRYPPETRVALRRYVLFLGFGMGISALLDALINVSEPGAAAEAVLWLPVYLGLGWILYRIGVLLRTPPEDVGAVGVSTGRTRRYVGFACLAVAIVGPLLSAIGYARAAEALFEPAVLTLAILGVVVLLQVLVNDIWSLWSDPGREGPGPLVPVLIGFALLFLSFPIVALTWGARPSELVELWERFRNGLTLGDTTLSPTDFLTFVAVFALGYFLTRFIQGTLRTSVLPRTRLDLGGQNAVVAGLGYVGIIAAAIVAITSAGIDLSNLAIVAGALSVGIGFGLQNIVSNFVSGIILLIERPVSEGDMIEVNGQLGLVRNISVRSTVIETFDRRDVIVPNADLVSGQVTNWTRGDAAGRLIVPVGVGYGSDTVRVSELLQEIAEAHPIVVHDPPPTVLFRGFGASSLDFEIRAILRDVNYIMAAHSEINHEIAQRFAAENIEIPFPQQDVWFRNPELLSKSHQEEC